jgi:hypothetical protein
MHHVVIGVGVVGERLRHEDTRIVDQRVNAAESDQRLLDHAGADRRVGDVARDGQDVEIPGRGDGARIRDHCVAELAVGDDQSRPDALRSASDDGNFLGVHDRRSPCL